MAVIQVSDAPSREAYDAINSVIDLAGAPPSGLLVHAAADAADGTVLIVDLWESDSAMDAFERERLFPALAAGGLAEAIGTPPVRHQAFELVRG